MLTAAAIIVALAGLIWAVIGVAMAVFLYRVGRSQ